MKSKIKNLYIIFSSFLFNPKFALIKFKSFFYYINNLITYNTVNKNKNFTIKLSKLNFRTTDRFFESGSINHHYFHQDLWMAKKIYENKTQNHIDVGSRLDGFIGHILPYCKVKYVDIRPLVSNVENLDFIQGSLLNLPFENSSVDSLSCLHVIEHIGLGRYGDLIDGEGHIKSALELARVLKTGGKLYFSTPIGKECLYYDAHRVFSTNSVFEMFKSLTLVDFAYINDKSEQVVLEKDYNSANQCDYGCGLFIFTKL
jgi:SAM-dependent methyltransferase